MKLLTRLRLVRVTVSMLMKKSALGPTLKSYKRCTSQSLASARFNQLQAARKKKTIMITSLRMSENRGKSQTPVI